MQEILKKLEESKFPPELKGKASRLGIKNYEGVVFYAEKLGGVFVLGTDEIYFTAHWTHAHRMGITPKHIKGICNDILKAI